MSRTERDDAAYINDNLARGLKVLEALRGTNFEPVSIKRIEARTGLPYDFCRRALLTLKLQGYAAQTPAGWTLGVKLMEFAANYNDVVIAAMTRADSEISESQSN